jgi:hypothetical protein
LLLLATYIPLVMEGEKQLEKRIREEIIALTKGSNTADKISTQ